MKHDESPTTFEFNNEEDKAAGPCGRNVVTMTKIHSPISLTVCIFGIIIGSIAFAFPEIHRNSLIHKEMFKTYERLHYYKYRLGYKIVCGLWIFLQTLHGVTIVLTIVGIKLTKPGFLVSQIVVLLLHIGILILSLLALITLNSIGSQFDFVPILLTLLFLGSNCSNLYVLLYCYRSLRTRWKQIQRLLSATKSVHFKDNNNITRKAR